MSHTRRIKQRATLLVAALIVLLAISRLLRADTGTCGGQMLTLPFTDVPASNAFFCAIAAAYFSGLTNGTTANTYSPTNTVTREQMAAFVTRTLDQSLRRGSRRAALGQFWRTAADAIALTTVGNFPADVKSDGEDLWVANLNDDTVSRVRASDGRVLETWTGADEARGVLVARGRVYVTGEGALYVINPTQPAGAVATLTSGLAGSLGSMAFDGSQIWIAHYTSGVTRVSFGFPCSPACTTTFSAGFGEVQNILYDGSHIWVTDIGDYTLKRLNSDGTVGFTIAFSPGDFPGEPVFDGTNIWVPNQVSNNVTPVRAKDSAGNPLAAPFILATLNGNGLNRPLAAAFDGERVLVINYLGNSVSLWKAVDLTPLGSVSLGNNVPNGVCSDGLNFWIVLSGTDRLARF
jgi:hypothetical protein